MSNRPGVATIVRYAASTLIIYLVVTTSLVAAYHIPSRSMRPTLRDGDWLYVNHALYGAPIPFTHAHLPAVREPARGDVSVFVSPFQADEEAAGLDATPLLVKRIVGTAGDTLYMRADQLFVNGRPYAIPDGNVGTATSLTAEDDTSALFDWQHSIELASTRFGPPPPQPTLEQWGPLLIPPGTYFMLGDNRHESKDSRYWGLVPRENIRGTPLLVYFSYRNVRDRRAPNVTAVRWERIGKVIR
jgi:signal peptidase I